MCASSASTGLCGGQRVNRCPYRDRHEGGHMRRNPVAILVLMTFLRHRRAPSAAEGGAAAAPREKKRALCSLRRRCTVPDAGRADQQFQRLARELPKVWPAIEYLHANTVEMPVYWEQLEPRRGSTTTRSSTRCSPRRASIMSVWFCSGLARGRTAASTTCRNG